MYYIYIYVLYIYVLYICVLYIYMCTYVYTYIYIYAYTYVHIYIYIHVYIYIYALFHTCVAPHAPHASTCHGSLYHIPMHCLSTEGCQHGAGRRCEAERFTISRRHLLQPQLFNHQTSTRCLQCLVYLEIQNLNPPNFHEKILNAKMIHILKDIRGHHLGFAELAAQWNDRYICLCKYHESCCRFLLEQNHGMIYVLCLAAIVRNPALAAVKTQTPERPKCGVASDFGDEPWVAAPMCLPTPIHTP